MNVCELVLVGVEFGELIAASSTGQHDHTDARDRVRRVAMDDVLRVVVIAAFGGNAEARVLGARDCVIDDCHGVALCQIKATVLNFPDE